VNTSRIRSSFPTAQPAGPFADSWPDGVFARYLTVAGATVDLVKAKPESGYVDGGDCTGCDYHIDWTPVKFARQKAQAHAETCRALPKPDGAL
jgi:hypothetical protein